MKKIILYIMLFSIIAFSGCLGDNNEISEEDFKINVEWNNDYNSPHVEIGNNHFIHDTFTLDITLLNDDIQYPIYYRVYKYSNSQYGENIELSQFDDSIYPSDVQINMLGRTDVKSSYNIFLDSIEEETKIEIIFSTNEQINVFSTEENNNKDVKIIKTLPNRKINVDIEETPIKFLLLREPLPIFIIHDSKQILIKNTGDVRLKIGVGLPNNPNNPDSSSFKPQYYIRKGFAQNDGTQYNIDLNPGESELFDFWVAINQDVISGVHQSNLIVYSLFEEQSSKNENAYYKKTFTLETTVTE